MQRAFAQIIAQRAELVRAALLCAVRPLASVDSPSIARSALFLSGLVLASFGSEGQRVAREFRTAFGVGRIRSFFMMIRWCSARPAEFFSQQRMILGRAAASEVALRHQNYAHVERWLKEGRSFILALSHFERDEVLYSSLNARAISHPIEFLVAQPPQYVRRSPRMRRIYLQYHQIVRSLKAYRPVGLDTTVVGANVGIPVSTVKRLRSGGHVVGIMVDSPWTPDSPSALERPFAGANCGSFATGVGSLARLAQCPVVLCLPERQPDGSILLKWSDPIEPPPREDRSREAERAVVSRLLDWVELEVGRRPTEYLWPVGGDRAWDPLTEHWCHPV